MSKKKKGALEVATKMLVEYLTEQLDYLEEEAHMYQDDAEEVRGQIDTLLQIQTTLE